MELESIIKQLNQKFAEPLPEFYNRRIIFWNDEDKSFNDKLDDFELENAKLLVLTEKNNFEVKKILSQDDLTSNYLVYNPFAYDLEDDWLLDIKLFSEEFRADQISMWMQEMNIISTPALRNSIRMYQVFLNAISRRKLVSQFGNLIETPSKLHLAILASICKVRTMNPKDIIKAVMADGLDIYNNIKMDLLSYGAYDTFSKLAEKATGCNASNGNKIDDMDIHIVLTAMTKTMSEDVLVGLENRYNTFYNGFCYELIYEWLHSDKKDSLVEILRFVEKELKLVDRFEKYQINDLVDTEILPCIDEVILSKLMDKIKEHTITPDEVIAVVEKRRTMVWYPDNEYYYSGLYYVALMQKFYETNRMGFHHNVAKDMWDKYTSNYYLMDTYYRRFHVAFATSLNHSNPHLDDNFKTVADEMEKLYKNWFLDQLSDNWTKVIENDLKTTGQISRINQQSDFYQRDVRSVNNKVFVIISDAMRYEVASSLADQLKVEAKSEVKLESQQAQFPTITKFGMAALLPKRNLTIENKNSTLRILADGSSTESTNRDAVLKQANPKSVAVKYKNLILMKNDERRELIKGQEVVYIYHDTIDNTSHHDEQGVFTACETAINELVNLVKIITGSLNGINIIITSDHGFLYTYQPLNEDDKMDRSSFKKDILEQGRRYVITDSDADPDYLLPVKGFYNDDGYQAFSPRENIRINGAGGQNFVHGGTSLQEMVVPVIKLKFLRSGYKNREKYDAKSVTVSLLSSNRKISNMIFNLSFYQKEVVSDTYVACTYDVFLTDKDGNVISDKQKIVADRTSTSNIDRQYRCTFNLKQQKYSNTAIYYLVIQDEAGLQVPIKEEFQIDISMSFDNFDFFG